MILLILTMIFSLSASLAAKIGIIISLIYGDEPYPIFTKIIKGLKAGVILGTVFLFLLPLITVELENLGIWSLLGLMTFLILTHCSKINSVRIKKVLETEKGKNTEHSSKLVLFITIVMRYLLYGAAILIGFSKGYVMGAVLAFAIALHQFTEAINNLAFLKENFSTRYSIIIAFFSPFLIPIGAGIGLLFYFKWAIYFLDIAVSFTIGFLIYLGLSDLIQRADYSLSTISFSTLGIVLVFLLRMFVH